jgi:tetratricopeptide (TPR) repeat protein
MTLAFVTVVILLGQTAPRPAAPPAQPPVNCFAQTDPAVIAFCAGQDALSQSRREAGAMARAVEAFRRAADLSRDIALKKRALEQLELLYDAEHLNQPYAADPILRELMTLSHGDLAPMFRLAKLQERQEQFDAAESTLLAARQQKPDDPAPWRELGEYFTRRAGSLTAAKSGGGAI